MKRILSLLVNKYVLTLIGFLVLMLFIDQNDWFTQQERRKELSKANESAVFLQSEIDKMNKELSNLQNDSATLERYAREKYNEKRIDEDVYIVVKDTTKTPPAKNQ